MGNRVHPDSPLWVLCCCGGLPILGFIKALVFFLPPFLYGTLGTTLTALIFLPLDAYSVVKLTYTTVILGPNLRLLLLLLLPFAFIVWLPLVFFVSFLLFFFYTTIFIAASVFEDDEPLLTGKVRECYKNTHKCVRGFWKFSSNSLYEYVKENSYIPRGWDGEFYEIPLFKVFIGLLLAIYGSIVGVLIAAIIVAVKFIPLLIRANFEYLKHPPECHWIPFWIIGFFLINALSPIGVILGVLFGLSSGVLCATEALKSDSVLSGFRHVFRMMRDFDIWSSECIFECEQTPSCIPEPPPSPLDVQSSRSEGSKSSSDTLELVNTSFLARCHKVAKAAVQQGELKQEHLTDLEPFVIIGIPAAALFDIIVADEKNMNNDETIECTDLTITKSELGRSNGIVHLFWPKIMNIRRHVGKLQLSPEDKNYVQFQLIVGGVPESDMTNQARNMKSKMDSEKGKQNQVKLNSLVSEFNSFAIDVTRLRFMVDRFGKEALASDTI